MSLSTPLCLDGHIVSLKRFAGSPDGRAQAATGMESHKVLHAGLQAQDVRILASDGMAASAPAAFSGITPSLDCGEDRRPAPQGVRRAGGRRTGAHAARPAKFWGSAMGMLQDRFGVGWMVSCAP